MTIGQANNKIITVACYLLFICTGLCSHVKRFNVDRFIARKNLWIATDTGINFSNEKSFVNTAGLTLYRYRLNPSDSWHLSPAAAGVIDFNKLEPGNYSIEIQSRQNNNPWYTAGKINFIIPAPFYNTAWFVICIILTAGAWLFFITRSFLNKKFNHRLYAMQQKDAIEKERSRIAADIHDDIGAELTNIAILSHILKNTAVYDKDESLKVAHKIEASSNLVIAKMNEVIWTLNEKNHTLKSLVSHIQSYVNMLGEPALAGIRFNISINTQVNYPLTAEHARNIFLVIKELLQNAIRHSKARSVNISIGLTGLYTLNIEYYDDGIGFDTSIERQGNGLKNIKRRVSNSHGDVTVQSVINQGCQFMIRFPVTILK